MRDKEFVEKLLAAASSARADATPLSANAITILLADLSRNFADGELIEIHGDLCRRLSSRIVLETGKEWGLLPGFLGDRQVILLTEQAEGTRAIHFGRGSDLIRSLAFAFGRGIAVDDARGLGAALTDPTMTFLIYVTSAGEIMAAGAAIEWFADRLQSRISQDVRRAASELGVAAADLEPIVADQLRTKVARRFASNARNWLWNHFRDPSVDVRLTGSLRPLSGWVDHKPTMLFFNQADDIAVFAFVDGADALRVLDECSLFELYLTDPDATYLISHNHHDVLSALGPAADWLRDHLSLFGEDTARHHEHHLFGATK